AERLRPTRSAHGRPDRVDVRVAVVEAEPQVRPSDGDRGCMLVAGRGVAVDRIRTRTRREEQSDETEREPHAYTPGPAAAPSPTDGPRGGRAQRGASGTPGRADGIGAGGDGTRHGR